MGALIQAGYVFRRRILSLLRVRTRGVKVMLFNDARELLLIRNSYGNRNLFVLPGGGIGLNEEPEAAAAREVREELGVHVRELTLIGTYESNAEGKRDSIHLFRAFAHGILSPDPAEVEEARFFPLGGLPKRVSPATLRRIQELRGERPIEGRW
jgi:ADP-ribose pyrophosphatase YjhB (NUDIX family)